MQIKMGITGPTKAFTFHYVSILIDTKVVYQRVFNTFTFHYVSILICGRKFWHESVF